MGVVSLLLEGAGLGCLYTLMAFGYSLVYNASGIMNIAQGEILMLAVFAEFALANGLGLPTGVSVVIAAALTMTVSNCLVKWIYLPLYRSKNLLAMMITGAGISAFLRNAVLQFFGGYGRTFRPIIRSRVFRLAEGLVISDLTLMMTAAGLLGWAMLYFLWKRTRVGKQYHRIAGDIRKEKDAEPGADSVFHASFLIGIAMAMAAGMLLCSSCPSMTPQLGAMPGMKAFLIMVMGGSRFLPRLFVSGILVGCAETVMQQFCSGQTADVFLFLFLLLMLLRRSASVQRNGERNPIA